MRILTVIVILGAVATTAARSQPIPVPRPIAIEQPQPQSQVPTTGEAPVTPDTDLLKWGMTQGGLMVVLIVVLWSYRRDFFRKVDVSQAEMLAERERKDRLAAVIEKNAEAMVQQALAVAANTDATRQLANNIDRLSDRRSRD